MIGCLLAVVALAVPRGAAASEGESALSIALGGGTWTRDVDGVERLGPTVGGVLLVSYERGFTGALSWRGELAGGGYGRGGLSWSGMAAVGVVYRFDVVKYVPYALLEVGVLAIGGGPIADVDSPVLDPVVLVGGGLDVLRGRSSSWGIEARLGGLGGTTVFSLGARLTWRWGFF